MRHVFVGAVLAFGFTLAACGVDSQADFDATSSEAALAARPGPMPVTYVVTRKDLRKCGAPYCGGFFIKAANQPQTQCHDGTVAAECYIGGYDDSALHLSGQAGSDFRKGFEAGTNLGEGHLTPMPGTGALVGQLTMVEGYQAHANSPFATLARNYYFVRKDPRSSSPRYAATELNTGAVHAPFYGLTFGAGFSATLEAKARAAIDGDGLVIEGVANASSGNTSARPQVIVRDVFTGVKTSPGELCLNDNACGAGEYCDTTICYGNCPPGANCPAVCWGVCKPLVLCMNNSACGAGEFCDMSVCHSNCTPTDDTECPQVCWGACAPGVAE